MVSENIFKKFFKTFVNIMTPFYFLGPPPLCSSSGSDSSNLSSDSGQHSGQHERSEGGARGLGLPAEERNSRGKFRLFG